MRRRRSLAMIDRPIMSDTLPIIDLGSSGERDGVSLARTGEEVGAACRDVGLFYVVNHEVDLAGC